MRHLVLGSRGQVGTYVVRDLLARGQEVVEWDILIDPQHNDLAVPSARLIETMKDCDFVHFLASDVGGSKYLAAYQDSFMFISNNMSIMENVFYALSITGKRFYYTSSQMSNMYHSTYGRLKAVGESYAKSLGAQGNTVQFWNVYGIETHPEKAHVITDFIRMAVEDAKILCRTDGLEQRQFMYSGDMAKLLYVLTIGPGNPEIIPITTGLWITIAEVAKVVANVVAAQTDKKIDIYYADKRDNVQGPMLRDSSSKWDNTSFEFTSLSKGIELVYKEMYP